MKTQEPFKWGFLRWQRMSQKQRTAVFLFLPHDPAQTTARSGSNDRTIQPQRPHDSAPTTARFSPNDRTIQPQRPHDPEQVYPSRIAKLRAERIKCFFPLATWDINRLFMPAFQMIGEEINHSPVEVFIHITKTMTLSGQHQ